MKASIPFSDLTQPNVDAMSAAAFAVSGGPECVTYHYMCNGVPTELKICPKDGEDEAEFSKRAFEELADALKACS